MNLPSCIILCSGSSIRQNLWQTPIENLPIWNAIKNKFIISCNWGYYWCNPTVEMFSDYRFYAIEQKKLDKLPLVIGRDDSFYKNSNRNEDLQLSKNTYLLQPCQKKNERDWYWGKDSWTKGFYSSQLIGLMALTFVIVIGCKKIYLLGADWGEIDGHTHFYEDADIGKIVWKTQEKTGVGLNKLGNYNTGRYDIQRKKPNGKITIVKENHPDYWYSCYKQEMNKGIEIYNVSLKSKITTFPKISYAQFYNEIQKESNVNQEEIQKYIISLIKKNLS